MATKGELELRVAQAQLAYQQARLEHERLKTKLVEVEACGDPKAIRSAKKDVEAARKEAVAKLVAVEEAKAELATGIEQIRRQAEMEKLYDETSIALHPVGAPAVSAQDGTDVLSTITNELKALRAELSAARLGTVNPPPATVEEKTRNSTDQPQRGYLGRLWDATF